MSHLHEILGNQDFKALIHFLAVGKFKHLSRAIRRTAVSYAAEIADPTSPHYWKDVSQNIKRQFGIHYSPDACRMICKRQSEQK